MGPVRDLRLRAPPATSVFSYASRSFRRRSTRRTHQSRAIPAPLQSLSRSDTWRTRSRRRLRRHGPSAPPPPLLSYLFSLLASRGGRLRAQGGGGGREGERPCVPADIATKVLPHAVDPFPPARCLHVSVHGVASVGDCLRRPLAARGCVASCSSQDGAGWSDTSAERAHSCAFGREGIWAERAAHFGEIS